MLRQLVSCSLLSLLFAAPALGTPSFSFAGDGVAVEGLAPGGSVVLYGLTREWTGVSTRVREHFEPVVDDDGDGVAHLALDGAVPEVSVWVTVVLETGELAVSGPDGFAPRELDFPPGAIQHGPSRRLDKLGLSGSDQHIVLVRPGGEAVAGAGAWLLRLEDGGDQDEDGELDGRMSFLLAQMTPLAGSPAPPDELAEGDVLAVLDPETLEFTVVTLTTGRGQ